MSDVLTKLDVQARRSRALYLLQNCTGPEHGTDIAECPVCGVAPSAVELCDSHDLLRAQLTEAQGEIARLTQERDEARARADINSRMIDIPLAWELTRATPKEHHHEKCSYRTANMLCDCAAARVMERVSGLLGRGSSDRKKAEAERDTLAARIEKAIKFLDDEPPFDCVMLRAILTDAPDGGPR